jgi:hypothetical protein
MAQGYYWVVTCKNTKYHAEESPFHGQRIPVGKADEHSPRPTIPDFVDVTCDDQQCAKTYSYAAREIIRWSGDAPQFVLHPSFE